MVWIQIRTDILSGLICVQSTVCKDHQQMTKSPLNGHKTTEVYKIHVVTRTISQEYYLSTEIWHLIRVCTEQY